MRLIGHLTPQARRAAGHRWFNSLPAPQAIQCLTAAGIDPDRAADLAARRPLTEGTVTVSHPALASMLEGHPVERTMSRRMSPLRSTCRNGKIWLAGTSCPGSTSSPGYRSTRPR